MSDRLLTLVRHGRTHANAGGLLQGHVDNELDTVGLSQAAALGPALVRVAPITRIIASPLWRAQQTAAAISGHCGIDVETDTRWIELDYGDYDGQPMATIESMFVRELPDFVRREDASDMFEDGAGDAPAAAPRSGALRPGTRVRHPRFGVGVVEAVSPRGGSTALRVAFAAVGRKTLIQEFARLQVIG